MICEIDESMCGKCKFGKGNRNKQRRQWIFGRNLRGEFGLAFAQICPNNKQTKKALWPIIQDNLVIGTTIFSDGWRAYRKLPTIGYPHQWLDHSHKTSPYAHPTEVNHLTGEKDGHTNKIEGFWGVFREMASFLWALQLGAVSDSIPVVPNPKDDSNRPILGSCVVS